MRFICLFGESEVRDSSFRDHLLQREDTALMSSFKTYNLDIDHYLNRFIPSNRLDVLPSPIARFLGHRQPDKEKAIGNVYMWFWACIGAFCGILVVEAAYSAPLLRHNGAPIIIGSLVSSRLYFLRSLY